MRKQTKIAALVSAAALLTIGAAMTSFAAVGWTMEDGEWVWLDRDGERVTDEWKVSNGGFYYLGEDGYMLTNQIVKNDSTGDIYYVDETGLRVSNRWVSVDNVDDETVGNNTEVDVLWYYFGSTGKAYKGKDEPAARTVSWSGGTNKFLFDTEGHMMSGWYETEDGKDLYYLGDENEGYAHTEWQYLELDEVTAADSDVNNKPYDSQEWFYFQSSGKAYKADTSKGEVTTTKYISKNNGYFTFDENGVLVDEWMPNEALHTGATPSAAVNATPGAATVHDVNGTKLGWVYSADMDDPDSFHWYYVVSVSGGLKTAAFGTNEKLWGVKYSNDVPDLAAVTYTAKSIGGKVYIFDAYGKMKDGLVEIKNYHQYGEDATSTASAWQGVPAKALTIGAKYYFSKAEASQGTDGKMVKGKVTHEDNGETSYYYFDKTSGKALKSTVKDNTLYGLDGKRIQAEDGNKLRLVEINKEGDGLTSEDGLTGHAIWGGVYTSTDTKKVTTGTVIVTNSGRIKRSGTFTIDDIKYVVKDGLVHHCYEKGETDTEGKWLQGPNKNQDLYFETHHDVPVTQ